MPPREIMTPIPPARQDRRRAGFTLVELLVAISVLSILLVLLTQVAGSVADTWAKGNSRADRRQNGRSLVDFIAREVRSASLPVAQPREPSTTTAAGAVIAIPDLNFVLNPATVSAQFKYPHALFWQAPVANDMKRGDLATVGYFIRWDETGTTPKAMLCRLFLNPGDAQYNVYKTYAGWISDTLLNAAAKADNSPAPDGMPNAYRGLFADNVVAFWANCLDASGKVIDGVAATDTNDMSKTFDSRFDYTGFNTANTAQIFKAPVLPHSVEVSFVLVDARTAVLFTPSIATSLKSLATSTTDANDYIGALSDDPSLKQIYQGATAHKLRIYLDNAP